ncbi:beta strand repeat-containing protein, partial [Methylobacterium trifolii]
MPTTIPAGNASTPYTITTPDTYTLAAGTTRTQTAGTGIQATVSTGATTLVVDGSLVATASGARAIRAALKDGQLTVGPNGLVQALDADAFQAQALSGGVLSTVNLTNLGRIVSTTSITAIRPVSTTQPSGYALNYNAAVGASGAPATDFTSGGVITNGAAGVTTALIRSDSADAIRLGAHQTLVNYGTIDGNGQVNDSSANNALAGTSTAERYDSSRGVRINAATATNDRIDNYGTITAAQHAVDVGNAAATNVLVNNFAGGQLVGRNGSGVGADTTGVAAGTVVVTNAGLIRGAYAPLFDRAGLATLDGDGDGVDVDGGATVTNLAGGIIEGTGAGGNDSSGRLNNSEGISIGGGTITNSGIIRGAGFGIVVNNDSNPNGSRSGVLATQVVNNAAGSITGQGGYAIRSENRTGTAAGDDDGIVNYGRIAGNGTIPETTQTVRLQNGAADAATVGILDGRTYTAADAGSVRFIRGDGSAVQTGEGADVLSNYGTLTGGTGRALNLEGGADTLNLYTGSDVAGRLDGGAGIDTLNLRLDDRSGADAEAGANSGAVTGTLADTVGFETLNVQGGAWTVTDAEAFASGAFVSNGSALDVAAGAALDAAVTVASG